MLRTLPSDPARTLAFQPELCPTLPRVIGCADFLEYTRQLERIDELLRLSGVEQEQVNQQRQVWLGACSREPAAKAQRRFERNVRQALRCNLARKNGLKNRMRPPAEFLRRVNIMAIEMT